jgi:hypothetical protein
VPARRPQLHLQGPEALIHQAEIALEVDLGAWNAQLLALDRNVSGRKPEVGAGFDMVFLAGRRIVQRSRLVLRRSRRGHQNQNCGKRSPTVHTSSGCVHITAHIGVSLSKL